MERPPNSYHEMNNTLRIAMECHPLNLWFEPEDSDGAGEGVSWHGRAAWQFADLKSRLGLEYKVITDLPPPEHNIYSGARFNSHKSHYVIDFEQAMCINFLILILLL